MRKKIGRESPFYRTLAFFRCTYHIYMELVFQSADLLPSTLPKWLSYYSFEIYEPKASLEYCSHILHFYCSAWLPRRWKKIRRSLALISPFWLWGRAYISSHVVCKTPTTIRPVYLSVCGLCLTGEYHFVKQLQCVDDSDDGLCYCLKLIAYHNRGRYLC